MARKTTISTLELEVPTNFWLWGGLAAISAVVKDNVWLDRQIYNLYPNIYVMFHAESGLKERTTYQYGETVSAGCRWHTIISGRSSIQGILRN